MDKVSIIIPAYNAEDTIAEAINSCLMQSYSNLEIIVRDNHSQDHTVDIVEKYPQVILEKSITNIGGIDNMNRLIDMATGDYIVMLCADDCFTHYKAIEHITNIFSNNPKIGYLGRYYYQFINNPAKPIRYFESNNTYLSADQWSGLAFRSACRPFHLSHNIFVETADAVKQVLDKGWEYDIIKWNTVAVRSTNGRNGSQNPDCYLKSPLKNWLDLIGNNKEVLTNFISLVQIKNWGTYKALFREIWYFIKYRPINLLRVDFWFFSIGTLVIPRFILRRLVRLYKEMRSR
jgi:glycosyltransferase involved in cell wall biosynthesis